MSLNMNMCLKKNYFSGTRKDFILFIPFQGFWDERTLFPSVCLTTDSLHINMTEQEGETLLHLSSQHRYNMGALPLG